jgi:hypothetical protein
MFSVFFLNYSSNRKIFGDGEQSRLHSDKGEELKRRMTGMSDEQVSSIGHRV